MNTGTIQEMYHHFEIKIELDETGNCLSKQVFDEESIEGVYAFSKLVNPVHRSRLLATAEHSW